MSVEIAWQQNILVTDFHLLKSLLVFLGFGSQAFVCGFSRQNINSVVCTMDAEWKWLNSAENTFVKLWTFHKNVPKIQVSMNIKILLQKTISLYCLLGDWTQFSFGRCVISSWLPLRCCSTWVWYSAVVVRVCDKLYRVTFSSAY